MRGLETCVRFILNESVRGVTRPEDSRANLELEVSVVSVNHSGNHKLLGSEQNSLTINVLVNVVLQFCKMMLLVIQTLTFNVIILRNEK